MVGLSDIPCVGKVVDKISDNAVAAMFRGLKYMFCYKSLVQGFDTKVEQLNNEKEKVSRRVEQEKDNGKIINKDVVKWQTDVEEIQKKDRDLSPSFRCIQCFPIPNPVSRLRLGREAVKKSEIVTVLTASGMQLSDKDKDIAYHPQPSEDVSNTNTVFQSFPSRQEAYGVLWKQLVSEDTLILGIYGMPGVGKTQMMEQICKDAQGRERKIFDKITKAVVGGVTFDVIKLQDQLASDLNCNLESKDDKRKRANQLKNSMMNLDRMLIIFDDVWGEIPLYDIIGNSFEDGNSLKGCKILYTSRERSNCLINKCEHPVEISTLEDKEALDMFKITLGTDQIDSLQDESLVNRVCKKCAGLPLVINAVGKALKFKTRILWEDALKKLEDCEIENITGIDPNVYACLKLSFDNLPEDAKQCLLLCSLFLADEIIYIRILIQLATGSQLVKGGRIRVCAMVETLKSSSLLLPEGEDNQKFKLHDIIRDVARSIAVKDYGFVTEKCGQGLPRNSADYVAGKVLHLELANDDFNFPPDLVCNHLHTLWLRSVKEDIFKVNNNAPKISVGMFASLKYLALFDFSWMQLSIHPLNKLKTIFLFNCDIGNTDVSCFPESLETLCIWNCKLPTDMDFQKLINLRELDILGRNRSQIVPNTISRLSRLEELRLNESSYSWDDLTKTLMPNFKEISNLTCLKSLKIHWNEFDPSQDTSIFQNLLKFDIRVGVGVERQVRIASNASSTRVIELLGQQQFECFQGLVERAEEVILWNNDFNISRICNSSREAFKDLIILYIYGCDTMEYLARIPEDEIKQSLQQQTSFSKLTILEVSSCSTVKYLFNNVVAECLVQLQKLSISDCDLMEVVVMNEGQSDEHIFSFSKLKSLKLSAMYNLKSFYGEEKDMHSSSTTIGNSTIQSQPLFGRMVAFPSLEILHLKKLNNISDIWGKNYSNNSSLGGYNDAGIIVFPRLTELELCDLPNLIDSSYGSGQPNSCKVAFPNLVQFNLQDLEVNLEWMELGRDDSTCKLKSLSISYEKEKQLPYTWKDQLSNLESLIVKHCFSDMLKSRCFFKELKVLQVNKVECSTLFSFSVLRSLQQLQELQISNCTLLEEIVEDVTGDEASSMVKNTITLFQLKSVVLEELPKLRSFIHGANYELQMPNILSIKVTNCGLSTLFTCSIFHKLQLKALSVYNCKLLEGIVADEKGFEISGTDDKIITVSGLSSIILVDLPKLRSFIHGANYELHMPDISSIEVTNCGLSTLFTCSIFQKLQLKTLLVYNCKFLEGIVADEKGIEISGTEDKIITVSRLSSVILVGLPNLKNFIQGTNYELHFPVLKFLQVKSCGLWNLFPLSVFQELQELKYLMVSGCNLLEGIVVDGRGIRTSNTNDKIITLPELLSVELDHLPNLKGFSLAVSYTFDVPKLYNFKVHNSPLLENITSLRTSTGLVKVHFEWNKWPKVPALNDFTNQNNKTLDSAKHQPLEPSFYFFPWSCPWAY